IIPFLNANKMQISDLNISLLEVEKMFKYLIEQKINKAKVLDILQLKQDNKDLPLDKIIKDNNLFIEVQEISLEDVIRQILDENPNLKNDFNSNIDRNKKYLIGQIMKKTMGKANISKLDKILDKLLLN
ncbi:Asp-tRNA(Asn)/Glu-tRNA(Gln) amidotransferase subunit GatB, partial [Metamycoplasma hyosynoviae]|nr:Asp-tRNA(Asn)/Glu-tRNA(Gln) amidotransferase subunit GatB [Metamycoplasma hyosynoviae]